MIAFPNCKINLGLRIISKRADGFHELETVFYPVRLHDALEIIEAGDPHQRPIRFSLTGLLNDTNPEDNLCVKAHALLKNAFPSLPPVHMHLHKSIPAGAGLGGGSADAAFTLELLKKKFNLSIESERLADLALQLGSDCPFFILNTPCLATGRGEYLEPISLNLDNYSILIIYPGIHISTAWAFSQIETGSVKNLQKTVKEIIRQPAHTWRDELLNDFEPMVFSQYPEIKKIRDQLYEAGAIYAAMSGSGSSVFGLFSGDITPAISFNKEYYVRFLPGKEN